MNDSKATGPESYFPSIEKKYGHPVTHWLQLLDTVKDARHIEQVAFLKDRHRLGHGHANALVAFYRARQSA